MMDYQHMTEAMNIQPGELVLVTASAGAGRSSTAECVEDPFLRRSITNPDADVVVH